MEKKTNNNNPVQAKPGSLLFPSFNISLNMNQNTINSFYLRQDELYKAFNDILSPDNPPITPTNSRLTPLNSKKNSRNYRLTQKTVPVAWEVKKKRSVSCARGDVQEIFKPKPCATTKNPSKKPESRNIGPKHSNQVLGHSLTNNNPRKKLVITKGIKPLTRGKTFMFVPGSTKGDSKKLHDPTAIYQNVEGFIKRQQHSPPSKVSKRKVEEPSAKIQELEQHIGVLQQKLQDLEKRKEALTDTQHPHIAKKYEELVNKTEEMYENYSKLAKETMKEKEKENKAFENYINACQEKEKATVDAKLQLSHQRMKIKLLQETLVKRNKEFDILQDKNKDLALMLAGYEDRMKEIYEAGRIYEAKILEYEADETKPEKRKGFIDRMLKKYRKYMDSLSKDMSMSEKGSSAKEVALSSNPNEVVENKKFYVKDQPFLNKNDIELLFPSQLKSYYASAEF